MAEEETLIHLIENSEIITLSWLIIAIPFITGMVLLFLRAIEIKRSIGKDEDFKFNENLTGGIGVAGLFGPLVLAIIITFQYFGLQDLSADTISHPVIGWVVQDFDFMPTEAGPFKWGIALSPLSVIMTLLLAVIAFTIHLYATEYMHADSAYTRFFGTLNFFTSSMFGFILASNLFMAFIFWELLGFTSYLLIGYYWPKASAASAAKKAFLYNKVGDVSFMVGIALIWSKTNALFGEGTLDYFTLKQYAATGQLGLEELMLPGLLIFGGAIGKSAQLPLFGWLPEAMEGPTPVSALLHSSTMVKAGLFLAARVFFTFYTVDLDLSIVTDPMLSANVIAWIGTLTALVGALVALTADDLKKVLAFSTVSQLGYIGLAIGAGGLTASFFHLIAHATFKSLLFLCAGAVIHSIHKPHAYMSELGGLKKYMPHTFYTMAIGLVALAGVPFTSGFWSKDAVLLAMEESHIVGHQLLYWIAVFTAGITAFYSTKMLVLTFLGDARYDKDKVHPAPAGLRTRISLWILAGLVVVESVWWTFSIGWEGTFGEPLIGSFGENFEYFLGSLLGQHQGHFEWGAAVPSTLAVIVGIATAWVIYAQGGLKVLQNNPVTNSVYKAAENRFGFDIALYWFAESPVMMVGDAFSDFDKKFIDGIVIDGVVTGGAHTLARASDDFDMNVIDGTVNFLGSIARSIGTQFRKLQTGQTPNYALLMALGLGLVLSFFSASYIFELL